MSIINWLLGKDGAPESRFYKIALIDDAGNIVKKKTYRIYHDQAVNEYQAKMLGRELARDAMFHAGWWKT